jgi:TIGR03009 family protein
MRRYGIAFTLLLTCSIAFAKDPQPPVPPQDLNALDPVLLNHLLAWETAMQRVERFAVNATLVKHNLITKREEKFSVSVWMMKPNFARLNFVNLTNTADKETSNNFDAFIRNDTSFYHYDGSMKTVTSIRWITNGAHTTLMSDTGYRSVFDWFERAIAQFWMNRLPDFVNGMTAQKLVNRFEVKLLKQDQNYLYLELKPRNENDKADFESMTLVLCNPNLLNLAYIPRMVQLKKANGQEIELWDFPDPKVNPLGMKVSDFAYQAPPKDWRFQEILLPITVPDPEPVATAPVANPAPACLPTCTPVTTRRCHRLFRLCRR